MLERTLNTILAQTVRPDRILVYLPMRYRRFPDWNGALPQVPPGVEIRRCENDLGPATKILPAAAEFRGQDCSILFCDDDRLYDRNWIRGMLGARERHPGCCIALAGREAHWLSPGTTQRALQPRAVRRWRSTDLDFQLRYLIQDLRAGSKRRQFPDPPRRVFRRSGYIDIFEGFHGVLVRPAYFEAGDGEMPAVMWAVDDVWLSGMIARRNIPIWLEAGFLEAAETEVSLRAALNKSVIDGATQDKANAMTVDYMRKTYGIWR